MSEFFAMGGYAAYVWPSYAVSLGALAVLAWRAWAGHRAAKARLAALERDGAP